jgi:hypothetical protein
MARPSTLKPFAGSHTSALEMDLELFIFAALKQMNSGLYN